MSKVDTSLISLEPILHLQTRNAANVTQVWEKQCIVSKSNSCDFEILSTDADALPPHTVEQVCGLFLKWKNIPVA